MKKIVITMLAAVLISFAATAQEDPKAADIEKENSQSKKEKPGKKETQEIIIRKNGKKDLKLNVEIDGDNVTINGKPMSEFKDDDVTISKKKMIITDGDGMSWSFNGDAQNWEKWGEEFGKQFENNFNFGEDGNGALLGVTTEKEGDGAKVVEISKGSAAEKAGLKKGDIITKVDEEKITSPDVLSDVIGFKKPKDEVKVTYKRDGKQNTVKAILGKRKGTRAYAFGGPGNRSFSFTMPPADGTEPMIPNMEGLQDQLEELKDNQFYYMNPSRKKIGLKIQDTDEGNGVKVINVEDSSAAATAGLQKGDIITEINGKKVNNTDEAREELMPDEEKKSYKIKANRGGAEMNFEVKIPRKLKTANL